MKKYTKFNFIINRILNFISLDIRIFIDFISIFLRLSFYKGMLFLFLFYGCLIFIFFSLDSITNFIIKNYIFIFLFFIFYLWCEYRKFLLYSLSIIFGFFGLLFKINWLLIIGILIWVVVSIWSFKNKIY